MLYKKILGILFLMLADNALHGAQEPKSISPLSDTLSPFSKSLSPASPSPRTTYRGLARANSSSSLSGSSSPLEKYRADVNLQCSQASSIKRAQLRLPVDMKRDEVPAASAAPKRLRPNLKRGLVYVNPKDHADKETVKAAQLASQQRTGAEEKELLNAALAQYVMERGENILRGIATREIDGVRNEFLALGVVYKNPAEAVNHRALVLETMHKYLAEFPGILRMHWPQSFPKKTIEEFDDMIQKLYEKNAANPDEPIEIAVHAFKGLVNNIWEPTCCEQLKFYLCCFECKPKPVRVAPESEEE